MGAACAAIAAALVGTAACSSGPDARPHAARPSSVPWSAAVVPTTADPGEAARAALMRRLAAWSDDHRSVTATEVAVFDGRTVRFDGLFTWGARPEMDVRSPTAQLGLQRLNSSDKTEVLLTGDSYYYSVDPRPSGPLKGRHWMRTPPPQSADGAALHGLQANPENGLRMLVDVPAWTDLGEENADDTVARHYQGTVTKAALDADRRLARAVGAPTSVLLGGADSAQLDVWADARGKPVRWAARFGTGRSFAVDFFAFGGPRTVTPPAARDTADAAEVAGQPAAV